MQQNLWYRDKTVLFIMDQICYAAFKHGQEECVQKLLYHEHKVLVQCCWRFALFMRGVQEESVVRSFQLQLRSLSVCKYIFQ